MALTYEECLALARELQSLVGDSIQAVWSISKQRFAFTIGDRHLYLVAEPPFVRFHLVDFLPKERHAATGRLGKLVGKKVESIELLNGDRLLCLTVDSGEQLLFEVFPKRPNLLLLSKEKLIRFSMQPVEGSSYTLPDKVQEKDPSPASLTSEEAAKRFRELEKDSGFEKEKQRIARLLRSRAKNADRKRSQLQEEREQAEAWPTVQHEGELLQAHFHTLKKGEREIEVDDWVVGEKRSLTLDPKRSPQESVADRFKKAKKMRSSIPHLESQIKQQDSLVVRWKELQEELEAIEEAKLLNRFSSKHKLLQKPPQTKKEVASTFYREYRSASGLPILVGKSAKDNDRLTFHIARGSDWWLHAAGVPGSHVVVKVKARDEVPDDEALLDAAQVALHYSKGKQRGEGEVHLTQRKYIQRAGKNQPGKVLLSWHKTLYVKLDAQRFAALKQRGAESNQV